MRGLALWPFALAVATYTAYQMLLKSARPEVNILGVLTVAYFAAFVAAGVLWFRYPALGANRLETRDLVIAAMLGLSIVGIEYGFVSAYRAGWPLNAAGAIVNVAVALIVVPIGLMMFGEQMSWAKGLGLLMCCGGLVLIAR
jgi:hypothetical protein